MFKLVLLTITILISIRICYGYSWIDSNGLHQFSYTLPPSSCKTESCIQLRKEHYDAVNITDINKQKRIKDELKRKAEQDRRLTYIEKNEFICTSYSSMSEFVTGTNDAQDYLLKKKVFFMPGVELKYSLISRIKFYHNVRIFYGNGESDVVWFYRLFVIREGEPFYL